MFHQKGMTLIEVLLSIFIAMFLLSIIMTTYMSIKKSYELQQGLIEIQQNGQMATHFLTEDIRSAGFIGCANKYGIKLGNMNLIPKNIDVPFTGYIHGHHVSSSASNALKNTDTIVVFKLGKDVFSILKSMTDKSSVFVPRGTNFHTGQLLMISDCKKATLFRVKNIPTNTALPKNFEGYAEIGRPEAILYFIGNTGRKNKRGEAIYALYRKDLLGEAQMPSEIVEGVSNMQIRYGVKIKGVINGYVQANNVTDWSKVKGVEITLVLDSINAVYNPAHKYAFPVDNIAGTDHMLHKLWMTYVALRQ